MSDLLELEEGRSPSHARGVTPLIVKIANELRGEIVRALAGGEHSGATSESDPDVRQRAEAIALEALELRAATMVAAGERPLDRKTEALVRQVALNMLFGMGLLQVYIDDPLIENVDVNGCERTFVTYADGAKAMVGAIAASDEELVSLVRHAAARFGLSERRFDAAQPELDLRLPDGSRLSAVMAVTERPVIDIRRHRLVDHDLAGLVALRMMSEQCAHFLACAVRAKCNILVSGAMNSGKTTMLRALAAEVSPTERLVTIEQALELGLDEQEERHPDCVAMEARLANTEGEGAIGMAQLVRRSLRMNASRVIVGEVLGDEIIPMLNAMSQGRSGSMGTIHADSSSGVFRRIAAYAVQAPEHLPLEAANLLVAGAINFIVHLDMASDGSGPAWRHVVSVREVVDAEGPLVVSNEIWQESRDGDAVPASPLSDRMARRLAEVGYLHSESYGARW